MSKKPIVPPKKSFLRDFLIGLLSFRLSYILIFLCIILVGLKINRTIFKDYPSKEPLEEVNGLIDALYAESPSEKIAQTGDKKAENTKTDIPSPKGPHSVEKNLRDLEKTQPSQNHLSHKVDERKASPIMDEALIASLQQKNQHLEDREKQLDAQEKLLNETKAQITQLASQLEKAKKGLQDNFTQQTQQSKDNISRLVKWYEAMKPKEAASIFDKIDIDILFQVSQQMNQKKMSAIMALMNIERVKILNLLIARAKATTVEPSGETLTSSPPKA